MVFFPSTRYGSLSVETSYQPSRSLCSATYLPQSEIKPFNLMTLAPKAWHSITFAEGVSAGITMTAGIPAAAAEAAKAPPALPAVGAAKAFAFNCLARVTAVVIPRALNEPVGFKPSSLTNRLNTPREAPSLVAGSRAVMPSPSVIGGSFGRTSAYRQRVGGRDLRHSRVSVAAAFFRSYFARSGLPQVQRCCSIEASYFFAQDEHSSSETFVRFGIREKSNTDVFGYSFAPGDPLRSPRHPTLTV